MGLTSDFSIFYLSSLFLGYAYIYAFQICVVVLEIQNIILESTVYMLHVSGCREINKNKHKIENFSPKFYFSNGHGYHPIKIW